MTSEPNHSAFRIGPAGAWLSGAVGLAGGLATALLLAAGWGDYLACVWASGAWCLAGAWLALWPVARRSARQAEDAAQGFVIGILVRMVVCLAGVLVLGSVLRVGLTVVALAMAGWYGFLLAGEVWLIRRYLHTHTGPAQQRTALAENAL